MVTGDFCKYIHCNISSNRELRGAGDISCKTEASQAGANTLKQHLRPYSIKMKAILFQSGWPSPEKKKKNNNPQSYFKKGTQYQHNRVRVVWLTHSLPPPLWKDMSFFKVVLEVRSSSGWSHLHSHKTKEASGPACLTMTVPIRLTGWL